MSRMRPLPRIRNILTHDKGPGAIAEGRKNNWHGQCCPPSFLARRLRFNLLPDAYIDDEYLGPTQGIRYSVDIESWTPHQRWEEDPLRLGTIAFWNLSWNERVRQNRRMIRAIGPSPLYKQACMVAEAEKCRILDAFDARTQGIIEKGDRSFSQWLRYAKDKIEASSPFFGEIGGPRLSYKTILADESLSKRAWKMNVNWDLTELPVLRKILTEQKEDNSLPYYFTAESTYKALRSREGEWKLMRVSKDNTQATYVITKIRDRCANGVAAASQEEWSVWHTPMKKEIYTTLTSWAKGISGIAKFHMIDIDGVDFYDSMPAYAKCFDVNGADKQIGNGMPWMPYNISAYTPGDDAQFGACAASGVSPTRPLNITWLACLKAAARDLGYIAKGQINESWEGGDNYAIDDDLPIEEEPELRVVFDRDDRCLGFNPELGRFSGFHATIDDRNEIRSLIRPAAIDNLSMEVERQKESRIVLGAIGIDAVRKGDCKKFFAYCKANPPPDGEEMWGHSDYESWYAENHYPKLKEQFDHVVVWANAHFSVDPSLMQGASGHMVINGVSSRI